MHFRWLYSFTILAAIGFTGFYLYSRYQVAPEIELAHLRVVDMQELPVEMAAFKGKKTLICFAASWCGPCREELKTIAAIRETSLAGVQVLVISDEPLDLVRKFKDQGDFPFVWLKLQQTFSSIGINSIPASYFINTDGRVVKKSVGYIDWKDVAVAHHLVKLMD